MNTFEKLFLVFVLFFLVFIAGIILPVATAAQQIIIQDKLPWWDKYTLEIIAAVGCAIAGYIIGQHYKNGKDNNTPLQIAIANGSVSGGLFAWILTNKYSINIAAQFGLMFAIISPVLVWLMFLILDRAFPGKAETFKSGIYIDESNEDDVKTRIAATVLSKRKDKRKEDRTETWTPEQRARRLKDE